jgi:hypothetical protein
MLAHLESTPCSYGEAVRALSDNRDRYIAQSKEMKAGGPIPELPPAENWTDNLSAPEVTSP